jgi:hypothetical protein
MDPDRLSLRLSESAAVDLTPLLHFWGTPPKAPEALQQAIAAAQLRPSRQVYDTLVHYRSLVPQDNQAFRDFALKWWGKPPSAKGFWTEREHAQQWDGYTEATASSIRQALGSILDSYFPGGRPAR